ncbi:hypothetical protein BO83DRAFT_186080 [Aspergillus eucalypticola CBS 122712]|uniref:Uncharacterized protein n=1 Tax=Aspergillus eucalypticola (strain CBS 122712 / IBT 29274) TaxID=1448314 RepID=A0A317UKV0_ASPEC|nr:uncharacterized protein BO83DRAFT_186080 [Aspergillus eucalypticola CBS 122712]PWY62623.1 hypothetical protein BO83DRAFT_186080 [Aspergillus eucalypticola CBS 122712]
MANQCSGHVFVIVQATNGNILTWRCSTATPVRMSPSGAARSVTTVAATPATPPKAKKNHVTHASLPLNRFIRTFPGTSKKPSAALLAPYLPKAYQPFLARLDFNLFSHFVCFSIRFGFSCNSLKKFFFSISAAYCALSPRFVGVLDRSRVDGRAPLLCSLVQSDIFLFGPDLNRSTSKLWLPDCDLIPLDVSRPKEMHLSLQLQMRCKQCFPPILHH